VRPRFIILKGSSLPREIVAEGETLEIGRAPGLGMVIGDNSVSRRHARLRREGEVMLLEDLGSTFGTFLNDKPVAVGGRVRLEDGDVVRFGQVNVVCRLEQEGEDAEAMARDAAFAAQANARLIILEGALVRRIPIANPLLRIGSAAHCQVRLLEPSRPVEAAILRAVAGVFEIVPRSRNVPLRLNEEQRLICEATELCSGSVLLVAQSQILFVYDYAAGGRPLPDLWRSVSPRVLLRQIAAQTRIGPGELKRLARVHGRVGHNLGEVLIEKGLVTPLFWRVICSRLPQGTNRWRWLSGFPRRTDGGDR